MRQEETTDSVISFARKTQVMWIVKQFEMFRCNASLRKQNEKQAAFLNPKTIKVFGSKASMRKWIKEETLLMQPWFRKNLMCFTAEIMILRKKSEAKLSENANRSENMKSATLLFNSFLAENQISLRKFRQTSIHLSSARFKVAQIEKHGNTVFLLNKLARQSGICLLSS